VITYIEYPQGTSIEKTNKATLFVEKQIIQILEKYVDPATDKTSWQSLLFHKWV